MGKEPASSRQPDANFLSGGGEMGARMRAKDWSATPLGPAERWPQSLKTAVRVMLTSRQAMFVWWGKHLINLYNDEYKSIVGGKHPEALGQPASQVWHEIWDQVEPRAESVIVNDEGTYDESLLLIMERNGYPEETYYTFSYSPVPDDEGGTGGILCANTDDTRRIIGERQLALLRELAARTADARTFDQACTLSASCLAANPRDLPFAMIYLIDSEQRRVFLAGTSGIERGHPLVPATAELDGDSAWPFAEVIRAHQPCLISNLAGALPAGAWPRPPHQAVAVPIAPSGQMGKAGILVAGLNPFRLFDDDYRGFLELVAAQIAASIANAQAYEEERRRAEALAELDRAKTAFFSNVSHELRTPLTLMLGPLEDVLANPGEEARPEARELLTIVQRNGQRLLKLVNTLLDFSRIEAGRVEAIYEPVDLASYTAELASVFRAAVEKAGLRLEIDCPPLPEPAFVDRDMWEKVVLNLISNAFKYTFEGEIRVALHARDGSAELSVRDTGTGIPEGELPSIFNRFHRVEGARGRTQEGTGIGLALVQELVKLHGGTVGVESVYGAGSTFTVTLPLGKAHLPADRIGGVRTLASTAFGANPFVEDALRWLPGAGPEDTAFPVEPPLVVPVPLAASPGGSPGDSRPRVVLADDNADMRDYVRRLLASHYEVLAVADGLEALRATAEHRPDLLVTDVMMPGLDGFGLLKTLRADPRTALIPIIMLSARAGEEARVEGLEAGADDYLTKPFSARELLARVGGTLSLARARREAMRREEELKAETASVLDSIAEGFAAFDRDFRFTYLNAEAERIYGMAREEVIGRNHWEMFPATLGTKVETEFRRTMTERLPGKFENFYEPWKLWFELDCYPARDDGMAVYFRDVTDRKLAMEALQEADRRKDEFLAILAHELRNPLAPIRNGLRILQLARDNQEAVAQARGMMERQVQQMVRLIDDLLDLSRISRGKIELHRERVDLAAVVRSAVETSRPLIEQAGHELALDLPAEPVLVDVDVTRLAQVFANLLNNAAKYTEKGGGISLRVERDKGEVRVSVADTGVGIPASMLPRVFEMFTQVDRSLERSQGGLGIGLSIVKRLVEMHGGTVEARSEGHGKGSEFVVRLPAVTPFVREPRPGDGGEGPAGVPVRHRILIADDNVDSAASLAMMLELMGNEVRTAHDGVEAVEAAAAFRPGVIILDIGMPRMNGYEACRRIREQSWSDGVVIAALTGWGQEEDKRQSAEAGFDHHLVKPVEPAALEGLLARIYST